MSGPVQTWNEALAAGTFLLQRGTDGRAIFPPRIVSGGGEPDWIEASGHGEVYSFSWISRRPPEPDYHVAIVELAEGPRVMSRVEGVDADTLTIGMSVRVFVDTSGDEPILLFRKSEG